MEWQKMVYDTEGNMQWRKHGTSSSSYLETDYGYDLANQITSETRGTSGTSSYFSGVYTYDANGNRTQKVTKKGTAATVTMTFSYDSGDKLTSYNGTTIPYDAASRPTKWFVSTGGGTSSSLKNINWDYDNHLTQMDNSGPFFGAAYNGLDVRTTYYDWGSSSTGQHDYRRDGSSVTAPVLSMTSGSPYGPSWTNYTPGISQKSGSTTTFQHAGIKNNDAQSTSSSAVSATRDYDAWGNVIANSGSFAGRFGYGGAFGYQEDESGLKLLGHRYYDPNAGRFLTRDPAKHGRNWSSYCRNNPLVAADPSGLAYMTFDGRRLKLISDNGKRKKVIVSVPAVSGRPGSKPSDSGVPNYGPIPPGRYHVDPNEVQFKDPEESGFDDGHGMGNGWLTPPGFWDSWGIARIPIRGGSTSRSGFYIHGGKYKGSIGCIDIGNADLYFILMIWLYAGGKSMDLIVDYTGNEDATTDGSPWPKFDPGTALPQQSGYYNPHP